MAAHDDVIALEVRTLDEDQEAHDVVKDDVPRGEHDRHDENGDPAEERPQLEDAQGHDDEPGQDADAQELVEEILDRDDPLADLLARARPGRQMGGLRSDDGGDDPVDGAAADPVDRQEDDDADQERHGPSDEPTDGPIQFHSSLLAVAGPAAPCAELR